MQENNWAERMRERLDSRTKPVGSLGRLETLAERVAGMCGSELPRISRKLVIVCAADHGVSQLSLYPRSVTAQMVANICTGGAAVSVLARGVGADVWLVDAGVDWAAGPLEGLPAVQKLPRAKELSRVVSASLGSGTSDWSAGSPAMSSAQYHKGLTVGRQLFLEAREAGYDCIAFGDMGIGNTASAAALAMALGLGPDCIDRGTGISDEQLAEKRRVIVQALEYHGPFSGVEDAMTRVGGLELLLIAAMLQAAPESPCICMIDGFPVSAAALAAVRQRPESAAYLVAGHQSKVSGHSPILRELGLEPLLDLDMRLGEGTGAVLAMPILEAALALPREMAGFSDAGVDTAESAEERY